MSKRINGNTNVYYYRLQYSLKPSDKSTLRLCGNVLEL